MTRIIFISNLLIALLCGLQISSAYAQVSYSGYSLIKAKPENAIQLEGLRILAQNEVSFTQDSLTNVDYQIID